MGTRTNVSVAKDAKASSVSFAMTMAGMKVVGIQAGWVTARYAGRTVSARKIFVPDADTKSEWFYRVVNDFGGSKNFSRLPTTKQVEKVF